MFIQSSNVDRAMLCDVKTSSLDDDTMGTDYGGSGGGIFKQHVIQCLFNPLMSIAPCFAM